MNTYWHLVAVSAQVVNKNQLPFWIFFFTQNKTKFNYIYKKLKNSPPPHIKWLLVSYKSVCFHNVIDYIIFCFSLVKYNNFQIGKLCAQRKEDYNILSVKFIDFNSNSWNLFTHTFAHNQLKYTSQFNLSLLWA